MYYKVPRQYLAKYYCGVFVEHNQSDWKEIAREVEMGARAAQIAEENWWGDKRRN